MARSEKDLENLELIHQELQSCIERLKRAIDGHKKAGLKTIWLHWDTVESVVLPRLIDWCIKSEVEAASEQSAYRAGLKPATLMHVEKYRRYGRGDAPTAAESARGKPKRK